MAAAPKVKEVEALRDHTLMLTFANGETRVFDLKPYLDTSVFAALRNFDLFARVRIVRGSLEWPGERDLAYDMLYAMSEAHSTRLDR